MSRTISANLLVAQQKTVRDYASRVWVGDCPAEAVRFDWTERQNTGGESLPHDMALMDDGTVLRVTVGNDGTLSYRFVSPTVAADWALALTSLGLVAKPYSPVAASQLDTTAHGHQPFVAYRANATGNVVVRRYDTATHTWQAEQVAYTKGASETVKGIAFDTDSGLLAGNVVLTIDQGGADPDDILVVVKYNKATDTWSAGDRSIETNSWIAGVASCRVGSTVHIWFCAGLNSPALHYCSLDHSTRVFTVDLVIGPGDNGFSHYNPRVWYDSALGRYLLTFREYSAAPSMNQAVLVMTPYPDYLTERVPLPVTKTFQLAILQTGGQWYLAGNTDAQEGNAWVASAAQKVELSGRVVAIEEEYAAPNQPGRLTLTLDNADGALATVGVVGSAFRALREGSQVSVGLGCRIAGVVDAPVRSPWFVERVSFADLEGRGLVVVECTDALGVLHKLRSRAQPSWTGATAREILWFAMYRVTSTRLASAGGLSTSMGWISLAPGTDWGEFVADTARWAGVILRWPSKADGGLIDDGIGPGVVDVSAIGLAEGASVRSFGGVGQPPVLGLALGTVSAQTVNHVHVFGSGTYYGHYRGSVHQIDQSRDLVRVVNDRKLVSNADCVTVATQVVRWAELESRTGWIEVRPDFALEVGDVVTMTYARAGLTAVTFRVVGMRTVFDKRKGRYSQRLALGAGPE